MRTPRLLTAVGTGLSTVALAAVLIAPASAVPARVAAPAQTPTPAAASLDWLERELTANGNAMPGFTAGSSEWGMTSDAVLALAAGGRGSTAAATATTTKLLANARAYATWDDVGSYPGVRSAGPLAKLLLVARIQGVTSTAATDGLDLQAELRATMRTDGVQRGRFSDVNPHFSTDASNGFGQALAVLALDRTAGGVPATAITFLESQQCPDGGFRLFYDAAASCTDSAQSDRDTTALSIQALLRLPRTAARTQVLQRSIAYLRTAQDASGGVGGTGPTASLNANTTGLVAQTMRAAGRPAEADAATSWLTGRVLLTQAKATGTPVAGEVGAIAYTPGTLADARTAGISSGERDQWRRATTQAVLGLGLPDYGSIGRTAATPVARTAAESYVAAVHQDFLNRAPSTAELARWVPEAATAAGRAELVRSLSRSDAWLGALVHRFYQDTLGRPADAGGLAHWTGQLRSGRKTVAEVAAAFYASGEYFDRIGGGTIGTWIDDLYGKLLLRAPDAGGRAWWVARAQTQGRSAVALAMFQSLETRQVRVTTLYQQLLGRNPDAAGRDYWAGRVLTEGDLALAVSLASSGEYLARTAVRFP